MLNITHLILIHVFYIFYSRRGRLLLFENLASQARIAKLDFFSFFLKINFQLFVVVAIVEECILPLKKAINTFYII